MDLEQMIEDWDNILIEFKYDYEDWAVSRKDVKELFLFDLDLDTSIHYSSNKFEVRHYFKCGELILKLNKKVDEQYNGAHPFYRGDSYFYRIDQYHDIRCICFRIGNKNIIRALVHWDDLEEDENVHQETEVMSNGDLRIFISKEPLEDI